jgi:hypothetical protein
MAQVHNTRPAVEFTFGICRVHSGKLMGMRGVQPRNTNRRETFTDRIHKGISRIQIRIENFM